MNLLTNAQERLAKMLINIDRQLQRLGDTPYGVRKATPAEQRQLFERVRGNNDLLLDLANKQGMEEVNSWLNKMEKQYGNIT